MPALGRNSALVAVAVLASVSLGACRKKKPDGVVPPAPSTVSVSPDNGTDTSDRDRAERERLERERAERERALAELRRTMAAPIYFGFDRSDLTAEARATLEAKWAILSANPSMSILIEGHADDLGSDEYNLALGQRRAAAAKRYLTQRDIDARRIEITSFGEEQPRCQEATEECRSRNRRDEFRITSGEPSVTQR
jgi:peptidoglycan-associated lipoprotein